MNASDIPRKIVYPWGSQAGGAYIHSVPDTGATSDTGASFQQGFPPKTFQPIASGGSAVDGRDENYILNVVSAWARWLAAGVPASFDSAFASAVGGYPSGALLQSTTRGVIWQSTIDGNTTNPDSGGANWIRIDGNKAVGSYTQDGSVRTTISGGTIYSVAFPTTFATACTSAIAMPVNASASGNRDNWIQLVSRNAAGFTYTVQGTGSGGDNTLDGIDWIARGY